MISKEQLIKNVSKLILDPLSKIFFEDSFLTKQLKECSEYNIFFYEPYNKVFHSLNKAIKADAKFHFGVECERFLFPGQPGFIYSFIDPVKEKTSTPIEHQWALCLWTSRKERERLDIVNKLNALLERCLQENVASDDYHAEVLEKEALDKKEATLSNWKRLFRIFMKACDEKKDVEEWTLLLKCDERIKHAVENDPPHAEDIVRFFNKLYNDSNDIGPLEMISNNKEAIEKCRAG